jgi:hypothetical protein
MKRLTASAIILLLTLAGVVQGQVPLSKEEKKELKKEQKRQKEAILTKNTAEAINSNHFVLKADQIRGRGGFMINVDPMINFVAVQDDEAFVQLGSPTGIGYNALGGITLRGKITSINKNRDKKNGGYIISMNTMGSAGSLTIFIHVNITGEMATASVQSNWGSQVEFNGYLVPWEERDVFRGTETF